MVSDLLGDVGGELRQFGEDSRRYVQPVVEVSSDGSRRQRPNVGGGVCAMELGDVLTDGLGGEGEATVGGGNGRRQSVKHVQAVGGADEGDLGSFAFGAVADVDAFEVCESGLGLGLAPELVDGHEGLRELGHASDIPNDEPAEKTVGGAHDDRKVADAFDLASDVVHA